MSAGSMAFRLELEALMVKKALLDQRRSFYSCTSGGRPTTKHRKQAGGRCLPHRSWKEREARSISRHRGHVFAKPH